MYVDRQVNRNRCFAAKSKRFDAEGIMNIPEYTTSLAIWVIPITFLTGFLLCKKALRKKDYGVLAVTVAGAAGVGIALDVAFADDFFRFPNSKAVIGVSINGIPVEEFLFYICGDWFIALLYVFCDTCFLREYSGAHADYTRIRKRLPRKAWLSGSVVIWTVSLLLGGLVIKQAFNPEGAPVPGYFYFITLCAFLPAMLLGRITRKVVNWRAFAFVLLTTLLISVVWEVTLALPRGWWAYQHGSMLGIFIPWWGGIPLEAVLLWIASSLVVLIYEFLKICFASEEYSSNPY